MEINYSIVNEVAIISWNMKTSPMNVLNDVSIPEFEQHLETAYTDPKIRGIIITSEKNEFIAGADVKMILHKNSQDPSEMLEFSLNFNTIFRKLETCGKPVVAAINGTALGGGYEICLACHHRIAINNPKTVIGLPEVQLGLLPGGGGTQRLPRLIGIEKSLIMMLEGKRISAMEALQMGMLDELSTTREEMMEKAMKWISENPRAIQPWDKFDDHGTIKARENYQLPEKNSKVFSGIEGFKNQIIKKTKGNYPAPMAILSCVYEGLAVDIDRAIPIEAQYFVKVATSPEAKNLISVMFLGKNEADKGASRPKNIPPTEACKVGILGAGFMGAGIAYVSAMAGIEVILKDTDLEKSEKGKDYSRILLRKDVEKGKIRVEKGEDILNFIKTTTDVSELKDCDLIIEAVFENRELKTSLIKEIEPLLLENISPKSGVFGSNTSTIPISSLADASIKPENFVGIHFFSPVDKMRLVEIVRGKKTSDYAIALAVDFVKKIRKTPIVVNDAHGFYTTRCFLTYTAEGMALLKEGTDPVLIENTGKNIGMPVGPLAVSDEIALDLILKIAQQGIADGALNKDDTAYQLVSMMVEDFGRLGKKNEKGFYEYPANKTSEGNEKYLWRDLATHFPVSVVQPNIEEVKKRLLYRQVIEAIRCLDEGVLMTKLDGNIGSILAWGFPSYTGGTLNFPEFIGKEKFLSEAEHLANNYGERFRLSQKQKKIVIDL